MHNDIDDKGILNGGARGQATSNSRARLHPAGPLKHKAARRVPLCVSALLLCTTTFASGQEQESYRVVGNSGRVQDLFGEALAISGTWLAVGAPNEPDPSGVVANWGGAVYLYRRSHQGWLLHQVLGSPSPSMIAFGTRVALQGDTLVVADDKDRWLGFPPGPSATGKAFVYRLMGSTWILSQEIISSTPDPTDRYGSALDFDGERLIVGEPRDRSLGWGSYNGAIFVYERIGPAFVETAVIRPPARPGPGWGPELPNIGHRVALHGDMIAATASAGTMHVEVFERTGATWEFTQMVVPPNPLPADNFGDALDLNATTMAIGRPATNAVPARPGRVDIYSRSGSTTSTAWIHAQTVIASNASTGQADQFGRRVLIDGDTIIVGAPSGKSFSSSPGGQIYMFERNTGGFWVETGRLTSNTVEQGLPTLLGWAIASQSGTVIAGERMGVGVTGTFGAGAVNIYERPLGEQECVGAPNSAGAGGAVLEARGTRLASVAVFDLIVRDLPPTAPGLPLVARLAGSTNSPGGLQGTLCLSQPIIRLGHALNAADGSGVLRTTVSAALAGLPILAGETLRLQVWYRDANPGPTANFSSSLRIEFE